MMIKKKDYNPKWSLWLSVDPLAQEYASWSPYNYVMQNPLNLIDPTGMGPETVNNWYRKLDADGNETEEVIWLDGDQEHDGYKNLGYTTWDRNIDSNGTHRFYDGDTKSSYLGSGRSFNPGYKLEQSYDNSSTVKDFLIGYVDGPASVVQIFGEALLNGGQTAGIGIYEMSKGGDMDSRNFYLEGYTPVSDINTVLTYNNGHLVWTDVSTGNIDGIPSGINWNGLNLSFQYSQHRGEQGLAMYFAKSAFKTNGLFNIPKNLNKIKEIISKVF